MKIFIGFLLVLSSCFSLFSAEKTKTFLLNKNEYKHFETNNLLVAEAIKNAFGVSDKDNNYTIDIKKVEAWNSKVPEFKYYPDEIVDKGRSLLKSSILASGENTSIKFRVTINAQKSKLNALIKTYLDETDAFVLNIIVVGDPHVFVAEAANRTVFFEMINEQSFIEKAFKNFFGENVMKLKYNIVYNTAKVCFLKKILKPVCTEEFELDKTNSNYPKFSEKITSAEYSAGYILFDLPISREKSNLTQKIEESLIKEANGTEHLKFYFCIPKDNQKPGAHALTTIEGKLKSSEKSSLNDVVINLNNEFNKVVGTQKTDSSGYFRFENVEEGKSYSLSTDKSLKEKSVTLTTKKDKVIGDFKKEKNVFGYKLLDSDVNLMKEIDEVDPPDEFVTKIKARMVIVTDKINPLKDQEVELRNANNKVLQSKKTDSEGNFEFDEVNLKEIYSIELPNYKETVKNEKIYLANTKNELVARIQKNAEGKFSYKTIPADIFYLSSMEDANIELTFSKQKNINPNEIIIQDFVYYDLNSFNLSPESIATLDKIVKILNDHTDYYLEIVSHTDCRGESNENLKLSQKRSETVKDYLSKSNVESKRLKPSGMGESKPLNACTDGVACTEDEFKMNRRTEFKFYKL